MQPRIMYIQCKGYSGGRVGRVEFSQTGKTIYYRGREFRTLKGYGYKANYEDVETGEHYWISGCKKNGDDTLYPGSIEIDEDVREEYWLKIREQPERVHESKIRSEGKYAKRRPR